MRILALYFILFISFSNNIFSQSVNHKSNNYPLIQIQPIDRDTVFNKNPTFTWIRPSLNLAYDFNYTFILVEKIGDQSNEEAISLNSPIFESENILTNYFVYPGYAYKLQEGKSYVWQVSTKYKVVSDESYIDKVCVSEPWSFTISNQTKINDDIPKFVPYTNILNCNPSGLYWSINNKIKVQYQSDGKSGEIRWYIYDEQTKPKEMGNGKLKVLTFENFYDISLDELKTFKHMKTYKIVFNCPGNRVISYRFKYIKPE